MKLLLTGSAGFIASFVALRLLERGDEVVGLDNLNDYYDVNLKYSRLLEAGIDRDSVGWYKLTQSTKYPNYRFIRMNLEDRQAMQMLFANEKFDRVCNLAAQAGVRYSITNPYAYVESNIDGFVNVLEGCRHYGVEHLVYASSSSVYSHLYGIPSTGLRFFTVYGPWGRPDMSPFLFTDAILRGKPIKVFNNGDMLRDFTYIDDIVEGVIRVIDKIAKPDAAWNAEHPNPATSSAPYRIYNIGNSQPVRLMDFIRAIEEACGREAEKIYLPMQPGDVYQTNADTTLLQKEFGYKPSKDIREGARETVEWYRKFYGL